LYTCHSGPSFLVYILEEKYLLLKLNKVLQRKILRIVIHKNL